MYTRDMKLMAADVTSLVENQCSKDHYYQPAIYFSMLQSLLHEWLTMVYKTILDQDLVTQVLEADILLLCEKIKNLGLMSQDKIALIESQVESQCWLSSTKVILEKVIEDHDLRMINSKIPPEFDDDEMLKRPE